MNIISIENLNKSYGDKELFKGLNLGINEGDKVGLIGRNGKGKTTLLRIISGIEKADSGDITTMRDIKIEYLPQNVEFDDELTVLDQVFKSNSNVLGLFKEYNDLLNSEDYSDEKLIKLTEKMDSEHAWDLESKAKSVLNKLGIEDINQKIKELSGGRKRRVALASALVSKSDLLILDEPTNHLDNESIDWLEDYLKEYRGSILMVTHDRYFLDRVSNKIIELDKKQIFSYSGNYNYFVTKKLDREEIDLATERKRQSMYRQELAWMRQGVKARGTRQKARVERFEDLKDSKLEIDNNNLDINIGGQRLGKKIIELKDINKSYGGKKIIEDFNYTILRDDKIGIVGENGAGKTTLMNILTGEIEADSGLLDVGETIKIGYFSQEIKDMDENKRAIEYIKEGGEFIKAGNGDVITASDMMELFLFDTQEQWTVIQKLSGGEKRRLFLLKILMEGPNFLVLDEPTNDLDIQTLNILEDYILDFPGPVLIVSHDRYFLDKASNKTFHIENAKVTEYPGNYSYFMEKYSLKEKKEEKVVSTLKDKEVKENKNRELKFSYNEMREWECIESDIAKMENDIEKLEGKIENNPTNYLLLEELLGEKVELEEKLEEKMNRWFYLIELKEEIDNQ